MNKLLKVVIMIWLGLSASFIWVGCAILGFMSTFIGNMGWLYDVTPFIGLAGVICIINCMIRVYKSNPYDYIRGLIGKATIQR